MTLRILISIFFGLIFSFIGFVNLFWGNDPYLGLAILILSGIYYIPIIDLFRDKIKPKYVTILLYIVGFLILWVSTGVGELFDKIELMIKNFPAPHLTGY